MQTIGLHQHVRRRCRLQLLRPRHPCHCSPLKRNVTHPRRQSSLNSLRRIRHLSHSLVCITLHLLLSLLTVCRCRCHLRQTLLFTPINFPGRLCPPLHMRLLLHSTRSTDGV
ncbi:unnamed protein product, partial [Closterium sp. NIES-54]